MIEIIKSILEEKKIAYKEGYQLSKSSYFQTGGKVLLAIYPQSVCELEFLISYFTNKKLKCRIFGATSNCIFKDKTNLDYVIFTRKMRSISFEKNSFEVESGVMLPRLCNLLAKKGISGFEELQGIPGSIGGAIFMNAGCFGNEISKNLISVKVFNPDGKISEMSASDCKFRYRYSIFHNLNYVILSARFRVAYSSTKRLMKRISFLHRYRHEILEYDYRNVGSVFVTHDIYSDFAKQKFQFKFVLYFLRLFVYKIFRVKTNIVLNKVVLKMFNLERYSGIISHKTMNVIVNNNTSTEQVEEYIKDVKKITKNRVEIELI